MSTRVHKFPKVLTTKTTIYHSKVKVTSEILKIKKIVSYCAGCDEIHFYISLILTETES